MRMVFQLPRQQIEELLVKSEEAETVVLMVGEESGKSVCTVTTSAGRGIIDLKKPFIKLAALGSADVKDIVDDEPSQQ